MRAELDDAVVALLLRQQRGGERAAAGAELEDRAWKRVKLARKRAPEERAELGRGDEIALRPELRRRARVVAEAGLVECDLHVAGERNPALVGGDLFAQAAE